MRAILLSVKPKFAHALLRGLKTIEVRRRFPYSEPGTTLVIYSSSPERAIIGTVTIEEITHHDADEFWRLHREAVGISRLEFVDYSAGRPSSVAVRVSNPKYWVRTISLGEMRSSLSLEPAQSYRYLSEEQHDSLMNLAERQA